MCVVKMITIENDKSLERRDDDAVDEKANGPPTVESLQALLSMDAGSALLVASNSAPMLPHDHPFVLGCLAGDEEKAIAQIKSISDGHI